MTAKILDFRFALEHNGARYDHKLVAEQVAANFTRYPQEVPLFKDHSWGPACGWVRKLDLRDDGLYAEIELTPEGEQLVQSETYKYVSPGLAYNLTVGDEIIEGWTLVEVSLTNMPAQFGYASIESLATLAQPNWRANNDPFNFPLDAVSNWDADATESAWRRWVSDKDPSEWSDTEWRRYRQRYLAYDAANPNRFSSYKLPVVAIINGQPRLIRRALIAAKAALSGARGGVDLPQNLIEQLLSKINTKMEDTTMNREELAQILSEAIAPLAQRIEQIENALREREEERKQRELTETIEQLSREIESWRYDNDRAIPPAIARSYAVALARLNEPDRTELLNTLRNNPPLTVPLNNLALNNPANLNNTLDPLREKYARMLGVNPETLIKYNQPQQEV